MDIVRRFSIMDQTPSLFLSSSHDVFPGMEGFLILRIGSPMLIITRFLAAAVFSTLVLQGAQAQQPRAGSDTETTGPARKGANQSPRERINAWTVGLAGGQLEGAPLRLASEIARVVDDGDNAHVLPIVTRGPTENVNSLLYLRGVDMAIINTDVLEEYKAQVPNIQQQITYVLNLFPSELHIFVRPEIQSLDDLKGKKVNFNTLGTAAAYSGPLIFARLGLDVEETFIPHPVALEQMRSGATSAVVFITSKPVDAFLKGRWEPGFKFLPVEYDSKFEDYYLPSQLQPTDYPSLIPEGGSISTIAVPTFLAAYNWPRHSDRYRRMARFVDNLFSRLETLQGAGFDPKWKNVNLAAKVPGLERYRAAQEWLDQSDPVGESRLSR